MAGQLREEVVQQVKQNGVKLYLVSLGPPERGTEFAKHTGFPEDQLLADPESAVYEALSLHNSALDTFFNPKVVAFVVRLKGLVSPRSHTCCNSC